MAGLTKSSTGSTQRRCSRSNRARNWQSSKRRAGISHHFQRSRSIQPGQFFLSVPAGQVLEHGQRTTRDRRAGLGEREYLRHRDPVPPYAAMLGQSLQSSRAGRCKEHLRNQLAPWRIQYPGGVATALPQHPNQLNRSHLRHQLGHTRRDILSGKLRDRHKPQP